MKKSVIFLHFFMFLGSSDLYTYTILYVLRSSARSASEAKVSLSCQWSVVCYFSPFISTLYISGSSDTRFRRNIVMYIGAYSVLSFTDTFLLLSTIARPIP